MYIILNSINDFFRVLKLNLPVNNATQSSGMELCRFKNIEKSKVQLESNCGGICRKKLVITFYIHWKSGGNPIIHFIIMWTIFSPFDDSMRKATTVVEKWATVGLNHLSCHQNYGKEFIEAKTFLLIKFIRIGLGRKIKHLFTQTSAHSISSWLRTFVCFIHFSFIQCTFGWDIIFQSLCLCLILNHQKSNERMYERTNERTFVSHSSD